MTQVFKDSISQLFNNSIAQLLQHSFPMPSVPKCNFQLRNHSITQLLNYSITQLLNYAISQLRNYAITQVNNRNRFNLSSNHLLNYHYSNTRLLRCSITRFLNYSISMTQLRLNDCGQEMSVRSQDRYTRCCRRHYVLCEFAS